MRFKDLISGGFFLLMACSICLESLRIGIGSLRKPGTGFFSFLGGVVLLGFALVLLLTNILRSQPDREEKSTQSFRWRNVVLVAVAILAYGLVLEYLGYLLSTLILMIFLFRAIESQPWWIVISASVCSSGFSYLLFQVWLKVDLPRGMLGIGV
jgi:putative tricarboxylic transport membrane protein